MQPGKALLPLGSACLKCSFFVSNFDTGVITNNRLGKINLQKIE